MQILTHLIPNPCKILQSRQHLLRLAHDGLQLNQLAQSPKYGTDRILHSRMDMGYASCVIFQSNFYQFPSATPVELFKMPSPNMTAPTGKNPRLISLF